MPGAARLAHHARPGCGDHTIGHPPHKCLLIAHRGACAQLPEHTLPAYALAARQGADFIEMDLVMTRDGELIARHDNRLELSTDVACRPAFTGHRTRKSVDGVVQHGWFSEDFTLAEIRSLRAVEPLPGLRPHNCRYNGLFQVPTLQEIIDLAKRLGRETGRTIGLYPETKHPSHFEAQGLPISTRLVEQLHANDYRHRDAPVFIQSFEVGNLRRLRGLTDLSLVQLLAPGGMPWDIRSAGGSLDYAAMASPQGLAEIAGYADAVGVEKRHFILPPDTDGRLDLARATGLVTAAHAVGLQVHAWTFSPENRYLPTKLRRGGSDQAWGDLAAELHAYRQVGVDGCFVDLVMATV